MLIENSSKNKLKDLNHSHIENKNYSMISGGDEKDKDDSVIGHIIKGTGNGAMVVKRAKMLVKTSEK